MNVTIRHLYPDTMNLYGEYANLAVLKRHLETLGCTVTLERQEHSRNLSDANLIYMGAGTERNLHAILPELIEHADEMQDALDRGAIVLFTGTAMTALGQTITDASNRIYPCMGLASFDTLETEHRTTVDVIAKSALWTGQTVGFMNKCSITVGVDSPLFFRTYLGFGNERENGPEGYCRENLFATHLTGPILVKNPGFLNLLLHRLYPANDPADVSSVSSTMLAPLPHEQEAYTVTVAELQRRSKEK
jgi:hypothetical protein